MVEVHSRSHMDRRPRTLASFLIHEWRQRLYPIKHDGQPKFTLHGANRDEMIALLYRYFSFSIVYLLYMYIDAHYILILGTHRR